MNTLKAIRTHIPAAPGWYLLQPVWGDGSDGKLTVVDVARIPIIGWLLTTEIELDKHGEERQGITYSDPILAGVQDSGGEWILEAPGEGYMNSEQEPFADLTEVIDEFRQRQERAEMRLAVGV